MPTKLRASDVFAAIKAEYRRIFTERRDDLIAVSFNAALVDDLLVLAARQDHELAVHAARRIGIPADHGDVDAG